jgi:hypothetical protein
VTHDSVFAARKDSSQEAALGCQAFVACRKDAPVHAVQAAGPHAPSDLPVGHPEFEQVTAGDHPVPATGQREDPVIDGVLVDFLGHFGGESRQAPELSPYRSRSERLSPNGARRQRRPTAAPARPEPGHVSREQGRARCTDLAHVMIRIDRGPPLIAHGGQRHDEARRREQHGERMPDRDRHPDCHRPTNE